MPDPARRPLDAECLAGEVVAPGSLWVSLEVADSLASSNQSLAERARRGAAAGCVLVAEEQTAGRGRHGRGWSAPRYSSVMTSVLLRPEVSTASWGWLPLLTALAVVEAVGGLGVTAAVKWPNDVLVGERKLAGVLCEVVPTGLGPAVVAGWGINVDQRRDELPDAATSVRVAGGRVDRSALAREVLMAFERWYRRWETSDPLVPARYRELSCTLGREVLLHLPGGARLRGLATGLDGSGHLVVSAEGVDHVVAAGDVVHVRPGGLPRWGHGLSGEAADRG